MDFDSPDTNVRSTPRKTKDWSHFYPVSPGDSGEGLPYAPEDWPSPGDKWRWKVGKRVKGGDRYLYLPRHLVKAGQPKYFRSKISIEQYVQSAFPGTDVNAFFASFRWKIPLKQFNSKEAELLEADSRLSHTCKAGNNMCISLSGVSDPPSSESMFCDICCSEPDFCRNCCCILCSKTISSAFGSYSYIRCKAIMLDGCICGHIAHIDCALQAHMVGTVGRSFDLDAEYFCRRCDSRTDLVSHIMELLQICESIDSRDEIEKILNSAICILHGSRKMKARQLFYHIESVMTKLKNGANFEDMWKKEEAVLEVLTEPSRDVGREVEAPSSSPQQATREAVAPSGEDEREMAREIAPKQSIPKVPEGPSNVDQNPYPKESHLHQPFEVHLNEQEGFIPASESEGSGENREASLDLDSNSQSTYAELKQVTCRHPMFKAILNEKLRKLNSHIKEVKKVIKSSITISSNLKQFIAKENREASLDLDSNLQSIYAVLEQFTRPPHDPLFKKVMDGIVKEQRYRIKEAKKVLKSSITISSNLKQFIAEELAASREARAKQTQEIVSSVANEAEQTRKVVREEIAEAKRQFSVPVTQHAVVPSQADAEFNKEIISALDLMKTKVTQICGWIDEMFTNQDTLGGYHRELKDDTELIAESVAALHKKFNVLTDTVFGYDTKKGGGSSKGKCKGGIPKNMVFTPEGNIVPHVPYPDEGSFRVRKIDHIFGENERMKAEQVKKKQKLDDEAIKQNVEVVASVQRTNVNLSDAQLNDLLFKLVQSRMYLADGRRTSECIYWWRCGVLDGDDLYEAFQNYNELRISIAFRPCIVPDSFKDTQEAINAILRRAKERDDAKIAEEERQRKARE